MGKRVIREDKKMNFENKAINLKDGRVCILRPAEAIDADAIVE